MLPILIATRNINGNENKYPLEGIIGVFTKQNRDAQTIRNTPNPLKGEFHTNKLYN